MNDTPKYIAKVEISNLWNKFDIDWKLNSDVNILAGINGSGKTTILDLICGLLTFAITKDYYKIADKVIVTFDNERKIVFDKIKIFDTVKKNNEKIVKSDKNYVLPISEIDEIQKHSTELNKYINIDIISTFDNPLKTIEAVRKLSEDTVKTELDWEIYRLQKLYLDYQLNISKRKDLVFENEDPKEEIKKLKQPQNRFLEIIDNLFSETNKKINREKNEITFITFDNIEINPYSLSSGEKQILVILLTVLVQDNKQSILFMDEPEISLHIDWQKKLIQYARELNPNLQINIVTHSPALIMEGWLDKVSEVRDIIVREKTQKIKK